MTTNRTADAETTGAVEGLVRDYHDARRKEDMWRIPQLLLALATPILALISVMFAMGGDTDSAIIAGALTIITSVGAALVAVAVWRHHRTAIGIGNSIRTDHPADAPLLLRDPL